MAFTPRFAASCWSHSAEIRNCIVCIFRPSYSCLHWALSCATGGFWAPLGRGWRCFSAMQRVKFGGSGTAAAGTPG